MRSQRRTSILLITLAGLCSLPLFLGAIGIAKAVNSAGQGVSGLAAGLLIIVSPGFCLGLTASTYFIFYERIPVPDNCVLFIPACTVALPLSCVPWIAISPPGNGFQGPQPVSLSSALAAGAVGGLIILFSARILFSPERMSWGAVGRIFFMAANCGLWAAVLVKIGGDSETYSINNSPDSYESHQKLNLLQFPASLMAQPSASN
jgi:hypothetical protein